MFTQSFAAADLILATLRGSDGCVLIPTDSAGRVLELALTLDEIWAREKFDRVYPLVLISDVARAVAEAAQSQLEWMSDSVGKVGEAGMTGLHTTVNLVIHTRMHCLASAVAAWFRLPVQWCARLWYPKTIPVA